MATDRSFTPIPESETRDLGFGTEVARGTRRRLLNRDGTFNVVLDGLNPLSSLSLYHWLLTISWPRFLAFITASYVAINTLITLFQHPDSTRTVHGNFTSPHALPIGAPQSDSFRALSSAILGRSTSQHDDKLA